MLRGFFQGKTLRQQVDREQLVLRHNDRMVLVSDFWECVENYQKNLFSTSLTEKNLVQIQFSFFQHLLNAYQNQMPFWFIEFNQIESEDRARVLQRPYVHTARLGQEGIEFFLEVDGDTELEVTNDDLLVVSRAAQLDDVAARVGTGLARWISRRVAPQLHIDFYRSVNALKDYSSYFTPRPPRSGRDLSRSRDALGFQEWAPRSG